MQLPRVAFAVVTLDGKAYLESLLPSIRAQEYPPDRIEIWVVDNGSSDGTKEWLQSNYPDIKVLPRKVNTGFAGPNNDIAAACDAQFIAFVNNDMRLEPCWLRLMVEALEADEEVACAGSRILSWDGTRSDFQMGAMTLEGFGRQPGHGLPVGDLRTAKPVEPTLFACGGAMVVRRRDFLEAGGFDTDYFAYFEDVDLGWRFWILGRKVVMVPSALAYHHHNGTSSRFATEAKQTLLERNALAGLIKNLEDHNLARILPVALGLAFKRIAVRAAIDRASFRFGPASAPTPLPSSYGKASLVARLLSNWRRVGLSATLRRIAVRGARAILARWGAEAGVSSRHVLVPRDAWATVVAVEDLLDMAPGLLERRRLLQAKRKRTDAEIWPLLKEPGAPLEGRGDYLDVHRTLMALLAEAGMPVAGGAELAHVASP